jgi:phosphoribosylamine--glycine ligase
MVSAGYPGPYQSGMRITGLDAPFEDAAVVFHAGTAKRNNDVVTAGGRVLGVTGRGRTLAEAQAIAYRTAERIAFIGCHYRRDIAHRALVRR